MKGRIDHNITTSLLRLFPFAFHFARRLLRFSLVVHVALVGHAALEFNRNCSLAVYSVFFLCVPHLELNP